MVSVYIIRFKDGDRVARNAWRATCPERAGAAGQYRGEVPLPRTTFP